MHGLVNKAIESFLAAICGPERWQAIVSAIGFDPGDDQFEVMRTHEGWKTEALLAAATAELGRSRESLLEDLGIFLICNPRQASLRRLLRFGGSSFSDFLYSLDDLPSRTRLAVPDLILPELSVLEDGPGRFRLICRATAGGLPGVGHVCAGVLRALADDYGVLAVIEHHGVRASRASTAERRRQAMIEEIISIEVHDPDFQPGRRFDLAATGV